MKRTNVIILSVLLALSSFRPATAETGLNKSIIRGFDALQNDKPQKALKYFQKAYSKQPDSAQFECYLGLGHFKNGSYDEALHHYVRAAQRDPSVVDSAFLYYKASCYRALGLVTLERSAWKGIIQWDPDSKFADTAMQGLNDSASREPASIDAIIASGLKLMDHPMPEKRLAYAATEYFREAYLQPKNPRSSESASYLGYALNKTGRHQDVLSLSPNIQTSDALASLWNMQRVLAMVGMKNWTSALAALEEVQGKTDVADQAEYLRIVCQFNLGHRNEAVAAMPKIGKTFDSEMVAVLNRLAQITTTVPLKP
jgi:tetratricopeptide (TPR) repeat protein